MNIQLICHCVNVTALNYCSFPFSVATSKFRNKIIPAQQVSSMSQAAGRRPRLLFKREQPLSGGCQGLHTFGKVKTNKVLHILVKKA